MLAGTFRRGVTAGAIAGAAYGLFLAIVVNPVTASLETRVHPGHAHSHGHDHAHVASETIATVVSVGSGVLWGILLGGAFGIAYYVFEPTLPGRQHRRPFVLAGVAFLVVSGVPWLVLPPTVPGAEHALGIGTRQIVYALSMLLGVLVAAGALVGYRTGAPRGRVPALVAGVAPLAVVAVVVPLATPTIVRDGALPAELVATYRLLVVAGQVGLWLVIAGCYGWLRGRADTGTEPRGHTDQSVPTG